MYRPRYVLLLLVYHVASGVCSPAATYDQRQTGDLNVQVHLKDVQVLALLDSELLDDYTEYDYFYDYNDFTVKPIVKPTTSTTTESSSLGLGTTEKVDDSRPSNSSSNSTVLQSTDGSSETNSTDEDAIDSTNAEKINETTAIVIDANGEDSINISSIVVNNETRNLFDDNDENLAEQGNRESFVGGPSRKSSNNKRRCRTGYSPNGKGRCRRLSQRRLSLIPLAIKLAPKLLDDLARTTKNLALEEVHRMHSN